MAPSKTALGQALVLGSLLLILHHSLLLPFVALHPSAAFSQRYSQLTQPLTAFGRLLGLDTAWKMYAAPPRQAFWIEWYGLDASGNWIRLKAKNLSPSYRLNRSAAAAWLWDLKLGKLQHNLVASDELRRHYARSMCGQAAEDEGWEPVQVKAVLNQREIRFPQYSLAEAPVRELTDNPVLCQSTPGK